MSENKMELEFRMHLPEDKPGLLELWTKHAIWDEIDEKIWEHRFGKASIAVAIETGTGKIVGQIIFIPNIVSINNTEYKAVRPFATFLIKKARTFDWLHPLDHPLYKMFMMAFEVYKTNGIHLLIAMPDPLWNRMLRLWPGAQTAKFPLWSLWYPFFDAYQLSDGYSIDRITPDDIRINTLWLQSANFFKRSIVRTSEFLTWKTSHFTFYHTGIVRNGDLVGFASSRFKSKDRQWLICDILVNDKYSLMEIIKAVIIQATAYRIEHPENKMDKIAILATAHMFPLLEKLGFRRDNYDFLFVTKILDQTLSASVLDIQNWYLSAND